MTATKLVMAATKLVLVADSKYWLLTVSTGCHPVE